MQQQTSVELLLKEQLLVCQRSRIVSLQINTTQRESTLELLLNLLKVKQLISRHHLLMSLLVGAAIETMCYVALAILD